MRHKVYGRKLGRNKNERDSLFKSLLESLILHGSIQTTEAKAKSIKGLVDKIINQAKNTNTQRFIQSSLTHPKVSEKLIKEIVPSLKNRSSGYTSLVRLGPRQGDGAMMVKMSLLMSEEKKIKSTKQGKEASKNKK